MLRAPSGETHSRTLSALAASLVIAIAAASPAAAQPGGSPSPPAVGGTQFALKPVITGLLCLQRCAASSASAGRPVAVRAGGALKVRGRNLTGVATVIFTGRTGTRDDVRVSPQGVGRLSVDVTVPARAVSGRVVLLSGSGYSSPSPQPVLVEPKDPPRRSDDSNDDRRDDAGGSGSSGPPSAQGLIWPVPKGPIFGTFGENRTTHAHSGLDIAHPTGTPIRAAASGRVLTAGPNSGYGLYTCIAHASITTCYGHQSEILVSAGATVSQGQVIGRVGNTGNSTGPHLHFEVRAGTAMWGTPMNPATYLPGGSTVAHAASVSRPLDFDLPVQGPAG